MYYASDNPNGFVTGKRFSIHEPCVTIMAEGMGGDSLGHWNLHAEESDILKCIMEVALQAAFLKESVFP